MSDAAISDQSTDVAIRANDDSIVQDAVDAIKTGNALAYSSIQGTDFDTKLAILEAVTNSEPFSENLGKTINLKDMVIQVIQMSDPATGEVADQPRIIFLDDQGNAYHAISQALLRSIGNLIGVAGEPATWERPVPVQFAKAGVAPRAYYTLRFGAAAKGKK